VNAFENTADVLDAVHFDAEALSENFKASADAEEPLTRANRQRNVGVIDMPGVLLAEQNYQQAQLCFIQARNALRRYRWT
jgi:outer membrane protein TolC